MWRVGDITYALVEGETYSLQIILQKSLHLIEVQQIQTHFLCCQPRE